MAREIIRIGKRGGKIVSDKGGGKVEYQGKDDGQGGQRMQSAEPEGGDQFPRGNPADFHTLRADPRYPAPGSKSIVSAGGKQHEVTFQDDHVEYNGEKWYSLMRLRTAIRASSKKGGWAFFGLQGEAVKGAGKVTPAAPTEKPAAAPAKPKASGWEAWRAKHPEFKVTEHPDLSFYGAAEKLKEAGYKIAASLKYTSTSAKIGGADFGGDADLRAMIEEAAAAMVKDDGAENYSITPLWKDGQYVGALVGTLGYEHHNWRTVERTAAAEPAAEPATKPAEAPAAKAEKAPPPAASEKPDPYAPSPYDAPPMTESEAYGMVAQVQTDGGVKVGKAGMPIAKIVAYLTDINFHTETKWLKKWAENTGSTHLSAGELAAIFQGKEPPAPAAKAKAEKPKAGAGEHPGVPPSDQQHVKQWSEDLLGHLRAKKVFDADEGYVMPSGKIVSVVSDGHGSIEVFPRPSGKVDVNYRGAHGGEVVTDSRQLSAMEAADPKMLAAKVKEIVAAHRDKWELHEEPATKKQIEARATAHGWHPAGYAVTVKQAKDEPSGTRGRKAAFDLARVLIDGATLDMDATKVLEAARETSSRLEFALADALGRKSAVAQASIGQILAASGGQAGAVQEGALIGLIQKVRTDPQELANLEARVKQNVEDVRSGANASEPKQIGAALAIARASLLDRIALDTAAQTGSEFDFSDQLVYALPKSQQPAKPAAAPAAPEAPKPEPATGDEGATKISHQYAVLDTPAGKASRKHLEDALWAHTHKDFRGSPGGVRTIMHAGPKGSTLSTLSSIPDALLLKLQHPEGLARAVERTAKQGGGAKAGGEAGTPKALPRHEHPADAPTKPATIQEEEKSAIALGVPFGAYHAKIKELRSNQHRTRQALAGLHQIRHGLAHLQENGHDKAKYGAELRAYGERSLRRHSVVLRDAHGADYAMHAEDMDPATAKDTDLVSRAFKAASGKKKGEWLDNPPTLAEAAKDKTLADVEAQINEQKAIAHSIATTMKKPKVDGGKAEPAEPKHYYDAIVKMRHLEAIRDHLAGQGGAMQKSLDDATLADVADWADGVLE